MSLPLDVALTTLVLVSMMLTVQLVIATVEIARLRRDVQVLLRTTSSLNHALNPWAGEDEITEPGIHSPPRLKRRRWVWPALRRKNKRPQAE